MKCVAISGITLNQTPLDWEGNKKRITEGLAAARQSGATVVCFPELAITGYGCEDMFHASWVSEKAWEILESLQPLTQGMIVCLGLPISHHGAVYNGAALLVDGEIAGITVKKNLAGDGVHYEPRWFTPIPNGLVLTHSSGILFGDLHFKVNDILIGIEICEDAWIANRPGASLSRLGLDILLNPSASHFAANKFLQRRGLATEASRSFNCAYVFSNLVGCESGRTIFEGDTRIASFGSIIVENPPFSFQDVACTTAVVDITKNRKKRGELVSYKPDKSSGSFQIEKTFDSGCFTSGHFQVETTALNLSDLPIFEQLTQAVTLGLFDYLRKSKLNGFVVSLSGGADSAAATLFSVLAIQRAWSALGEDEFKNKLCHAKSILKSISQKTTSTELAQQFVTCVYQGTSNSSPQTLAAAAHLTESLGISLLNWNIDPLVTCYTEMVERATNEKITWATHDIVKQNIQTRVRAPGVWMLANLKGSLLLTTGNRSEAAVGYATMDGDTCGGFNPIGGVSKSLLLRWLKWLLTEGSAYSGPHGGLRLTLNLQPTAELRPLTEHQTDEKDLMPYDVLEFIELQAIFYKRSPAVVYEATKYQFGTEHSHKEIKEFVVKFFRLLSQSQWKRERFAASFHLDTFNIDPRSGLRFPILNSNFKEEIAALERV
jgi:NAD+ synthase (glutamine-hydrolysing)